MKETDKIMLVSYENLGNLSATTIDVTKFLHNVS